MPPAQTCSDSGRQGDETIHSSRVTICIITLYYLCLYTLQFHCCNDIIKYLAEW